MQTLTIKCTVCDQVLVTVEKETIDPSDEALWRASVVCDLGHGGPSIGLDLAGAPGVE